MKNIIAAIKNRRGKIKKLILEYNTLQDKKEKDKKLEEIRVLQKEISGLKKYLENPISSYEDDWDI